MRILFVCTGNTCRSAMAEAIAVKAVTTQPEQYKEFQITSAGLLCAGTSPATPEAVMAAARNGCDLSKFQAKQLTEKLVEEADYIFVMTKTHKQMLEHALPQCIGKTFLLRAYANADPTAPDIIDPYGGSQEQYNACFVELKESIMCILERLKTLV